MFFTLFFIFLASTEIPFTSAISPIDATSFTLGTVESLASIGGFAHSLSSRSRKTAVISISIFGFEELFGREVDYILHDIDTSDTRRSFIMAPPILGENSIFEIGFDDNEKDIELNLYYTNKYDEHVLRFEFNWFWFPAFDGGVLLYRPRLTLKINSVFVLIMQDHETEPHYFVTEIIKEKLTINNESFDSLCYGGFELATTTPDVGHNNCILKPSSSVISSEFILEGNSECSFKRTDNPVLVSSRINHDIYKNEISEGTIKILCADEMVFKIKKNFSTFTIKKADGTVIEKITVQTGSTYTNHYTNLGKGMKCSFELRESDFYVKTIISCFVN